MSNLKANINILTSIHVNEISKLSHNLLSIIPLAKNNVELLLKKTSLLLEIFINKKVFSLLDIIKN